jgi:hypothetical protein
MILHTPGMTSSSYMTTFVVLLLWKFQNYKIKKKKKVERVLLQTPVYHLLSWHHNQYFANIISAYWHLPPVLFVTFLVD